MANLTIAVDDQLLKAARIRALEQGTSVNALLRDYLEAYSGLRARQLAAADDILKLSRETNSGSGGKRWTRDEIHERR